MLVTYVKSFSYATLISARAHRIDVLDIDYWRFEVVGPLFKHKCIYMYDIATVLVTA